MNAITANERVIDEDRTIVPNARPEKFAHIVIHTNRFAEMQNFYKTLLLATSAFANEVLDFMRYDEEHHRVVLVNMPDFADTPPATNRTHHIAFSYKTLGELIGAFERMAENNIHPTWCINHGLTTSIYYTDPDGTHVETQYDNLGVEEADAFMRGPYFQVNPIGVHFDPYELKRRYQAGVPLEELIRQGSAPLPDDVEPVTIGGIEYDYRGKLLPDYA